MKFRKFGKTVLTAALSSAIVFSLSSCVRSFTAGYLYVTGTVTATPTGNGIISGFKINNNNGKLTTMHGLPLGSGGANPVRIVLLSGGNFVYVLNAGATASGSATCTTADPCLNSNITEFAVGGNGILTYQNTFFSQGTNPIRMLSDTSGTHLIVLDHDAPANTYCSAIISGATSCGDITIFTIDQTTGRLTLVTNAQLTTSAGTQVTYFPVQANPIDMATTSAYVMTLAGAPSSGPTAVVTTASQGQTIYPYTYSATTGQLTTTQSTPQIINNGLGNYVGQATALVYAGSKMYVLDNEVLANGVPGQILPFTIGTNGALQSLVGGAVADDSTQESPIYLIQDSKAKFIYVANQGGSSITNGAGIVGYRIDPSSAQLTENSGSPYITGTGAVPVCLLEDPSNQYIYTANAGDSTVTGKLLDPNAGVLNQMQGWPGSIKLDGPATWCVATGRTN